MKKLQNTVFKNSSFLGILLIFLSWSLISFFEILPKFLLPTPYQVFKVFITDFNILIEHLAFTVFEALLGILISIILGFLFSILMDRFKFIYDLFYPIIIISQTIPTIAIAPIIVLWFGFGILPKILLIVSTCFFPITISILTGINAIDKDFLRLMDSMDSNYLNTLLFVKIPYSLKSFFSGLKIAVSYSVVAAVVAEWLGGEKGIGVYMIKVKKAYAFDKMFASIIIISVTSIILVMFVKFLEKKIIYWTDY